MHGVTAIITMYCPLPCLLLGELLLVVEYCKHGNILDYMRRRRKEFVDQMSENAGLGSGQVANSSNQEFQ